MQRAIILLLVMSLLGTGLGLWMESSLSNVCQRYLAQTNRLRQLVQQNALADALQMETELYDVWHLDCRRLNALVSHHHTRAVDEAFMALTTALENGWQQEALRALDSLAFSLNDLETDMTLRWENVL